MKYNMKAAVVYGVCFLIIFNLFFLPGISDGRETTGMFTLISFLVALINTLLFWLFKFILRKSQTGTNILTNCMLLFLLSEFTVFCMLGGEVCLFGVFYKLHYYSKAEADIIAFREKRDFALSISFLISTIVTGIIGLIFFKEPISQKQIPIN